MLAFSEHTPVVGVSGNLQCLGNQAPALQEPGHTVHLVLHHSTTIGKAADGKQWGLLLLQAAQACE